MQEGYWRFEEIFFLSNFQQWSRVISDEHESTQIIIINVNKEKRICQIVDVAVWVKHRINMKGSEKLGKYLNLKNLENTMVIVMRIIVDELKLRLDKLEFWGNVENIQTMSLLRSEIEMHEILLILLLSNHEVLIYKRLF